MESVTQISLTSGELRYLIDLMWSSDADKCHNLSLRYHVNDSSLIEKLQTTLGENLSN
jgi:hypothetical protein